MPLVVLLAKTQGKVLALLVSVEARMANNPEGFRIRDNRGGCWYYINNAFLRGNWGRVLGPHAIAIYNAIVIHADDKTQDCWPSYQTMADLTGMSRRQAIREVKKLAARHIISITKIKGKSNMIDLLHQDEWGKTSDR